ncbi:MAG TPA: ParB/RepB/Spo0J family partition protein [Candidatus Dormibacteraeota bacterium]
MPSRSDLRKKVTGAFADEDVEDLGPSRGLFDSATGAGQLRRIPVGKIAPRADQPRQSMEPAALDELTESIRAHGVLQPIRVRPGEAGGYEIIAGERRWTAARRAGLREIPAVIAEAGDDEAYVESLIENIQREDLNAVDRARALKRLRVDLGLQSWEEVGRVVGITRRHVHNLLNISRLPEPIQQDIRVGDLTEKHGRALLRLEGHPAQQLKLWALIHAEGLSGDAALETAKELRPTTASPRRLGPPTGPTAARDVATAVDTLLALLTQAEPAALAAVRDRLEELRDRLGDALVTAPVAAVPKDGSPGV